jgi:hypothetical protein
MVRVIVFPADKATSAFDDQILSTVACKDDASSIES